VITIAYSRLYLGVHWLSDILGGVVFGASWWRLWRCHSSHTAAPYHAFGIARATFVVFGCRRRNISNNFERAENSTPPLNNPIPWCLPNGNFGSRICRSVARLAGKPESVCPAVGGLLRPAENPEGRGCYSPKWTWRDSIPYLDPNAVLGGVAPRPALHLGLKAKLTMTMALNSEANRRLVMRAYKTNANLKSTIGTPIFLISLTQESLRKSLRAYVVPTLFGGKCRKAAILRTLALAENTRTVTEQRPGDGGEVRLITLP
jgi:undecaprenyl-diphosphatase